MNSLGSARVSQIIPLFAPRFSNASKAKGEQYFRSNTVQVLSGSAVEIQAQVQGSLSYVVSIRVITGGAHFFCDCPHFSEHSVLCKHLWATVLAAAEHDYLSAAISQAPEAGALAPTPVPVRPAPWRRQLSEIAGEAASQPSAGSAWPAEAELVYLLDLGASRSAGKPVITIASRTRGKDGTFKYPPKPRAFSRAQLGMLPLAEDREILTQVLGGEPYPSYGYYDGYDRRQESFSLSPHMAQPLLRAVLHTGRCFRTAAPEEAGYMPLAWDGEGAWTFRLSVFGSRQQGWQLTGDFRRGAERMAAKDPLMVFRNGMLVTRTSVAPWSEDASFAWVQGIRTRGDISVSEQDREDFFGDLIHSPGLPPMDLPQDWHYEEVSPAARACLKIYRPRFQFRSAQDRLHAELSFAYEDRVVQQEVKSLGIYDAASRRLLRRDRAYEQAATQQLQDLGLRYAPGDLTDTFSWSVATSKLPKVVRALVELGWQVSAEGKVFRQPGKSGVSVTSGLDWFELHAEVEYGETSAKLPQLLAALKRGDGMVFLDDGSYGLLPEVWLQRFSPVAAMGEATGDHMRFLPGQAGLLDALLATQPMIDCDAAFQHVRKELARFQTIEPAEQPAGFQGELRGYQREGLSWMHFLRQFGFGGCLADDMGVGKTAQVLALLETRRELRAAGQVDAPSLAVVPKSLIFNWKQEVERFTPQLRVLDYTGTGRRKEDIDGYDLVLTTYGTLRRDALHFKDKVFDYVILDEAQAIKNEKTGSAKAARLLRGKHRLAMSGTPVENHLGELWSLFEFLNPGMLGASGAFALTSSSKRDPDLETRRILAHALRPFLLRRTKEQVAKELPPKNEQTIYCELEPAQRALYDELRNHYRDALLQKIGTKGLGKSKIMVLEALLRLRQAACHPGLVDRKRIHESSAKLEVLMEQLQAVLEEGHKALVFSQFTSLLGILKKRLDGQGMVYEYLDGKTVDREARVARFQNDAECGLFLISLKAGGVGLNLTAADYVFILDPWWNPAVEAQAVDRAHRIGQLRQVFAYRLIARDTVEEKVLQLQEKKRGLADAIIGADNSLIRDLTVEDIELLLS